MAVVSSALLHTATRTLSSVGMVSVIWGCTRFLGTSILVTSEVFATVIMLSSLRTVMRHTLGGMSVSLMLEVMPGDRH